MSSQHTDADYRIYTGAVVATLILAPFYLAAVIWWLSR
jgi:hypothetical protein